MTMSVAMTDRERVIRQRLKDDFPHYAARCLKIRSKSSGLVPLELNKAQLYIHQRLEEQRQRTGMVRAWILKGRQQGCSTYTEGRYFWRLTHSLGSRAMILTHMQDATDNLFGMVDRYYEHCPDLVKPVRGVSNAKELNFRELDSSYRAATAGSKGAGRSETVQFFHGSEVAYWPNAADHLSGALQAVPLEPGTEVILESTANDVGDAFHTGWQQAESGVSDFIAIFVPWFWQDEYRRAVPPDFELSEEEDEYKAAHGLDDEQIAWRRAKIIEFQGDAIKFKREYPATAAEAFEQSSELSLIKPELVLAARRRIIDQRIDQPLVIGFDPAGEGATADRSALIRRCGREAFGKEVFQRKTPMQLVGIVAKIIDLEKPDKVFIDLGERGHGIVDRLKELGYGKIVTGINFGSVAMRDDIYANRRAEMYDTMRQWFETEGGVMIPDDDELHADIISVRRKLTSVHTKLLLESKEDMRKRGVRSPDVSDALALTFAMPVARTEIRAQTRRVSNATSYRGLDYR